MLDELEVDEAGYVWLGGMRICRIVVGGWIEFYDRNRIHSRIRGSPFVYTTPEELHRVLTLRKEEKE